MNFVAILYQLDEYMHTTVSCISHVYAYNYRYYTRFFAFCAILLLSFSPIPFSHYQLLVKYHHSLNCALQVMENLLCNLRYQMFTLVAADNAVRAVGATKLMEEYFDSCNFGVSSI